MSSDPLNRLPPAAPPSAPPPPSPWLHPLGRDGAQGAATYGAPCQQRELWPLILAFVGLACLFAVRRAAGRERVCALR